MRKVAIVTDSTCCLPGELVERYGIRLVPLLIVHKGKSYRDGIDISAPEVYEIMRRRKDLPTTSTPSVGDFLDAYSQASRTAESVLCITLTSLQSKIFDVAVMAKGAAGETMPNTPIEVMDSRAAAGALGFIVLEAARVASRGADLTLAKNAAQDMMSRVNFLAMVDTLFYLARTGRIARAAAWAGSLLDVKPILEHSPAIGETMPVARPRTKRKAIQHMLKIMADRAGTSRVRAMVHHADELVEAEKLAEEIRSRFDCAELHLTDMTPTIGVHAGPGLLGITFCSE